MQHFIVIKEIDVNFFDTFDMYALESANDELTAIRRGYSAIGKWAKDNGVVLTQKTYTNSSIKMHKVVLYATMSDIQRTDYALRF